MDLDDHREDVRGGEDHSTMPAFPGPRPSVSRRKSSAAACNCYVSAPGLDRVPTRLCAHSGGDESSRAAQEEGLFHVASLANGFQMTLTITNPREVFRNLVLASEKRRLSEFRSRVRDRW